MVGIADEMYENAAQIPDVSEEAGDLLDSYRLRTADSR